MSANPDLSLQRQGRSVLFACLTGAILAFLIIPGSLLLLSAAYDVPLDLGILSLAIALRMAIAAAPFVLIWMGSMPLLLLLPGQRQQQFSLGRCALHGAACGMLYYLVIAALFYEPDHFGTLHDAPNFIAYSLLDWGGYPAFGLGGAVCGVIFSLVQVGLDTLFGRGR